MNRTPVDWRALTDPYRRCLAELESRALRVRARGPDDPPVSLALGHAEADVRARLCAALVEACLPGCPKSSGPFDDAVDVAWARWLDARCHAVRWSREAEAAAGRRTGWRHTLSQAARVEGVILQVAANDAREALLRRLGQRLAGSLDSVIMDPEPAAAPTPTTAEG